MEYVGVYHSLGSRKDNFCERLFDNMFVHNVEDTEKVWLSTHGKKE